MSERNPLGRLDPNEVYAKLLQLGEEWADAHAGASFLEEIQKSLLSRIIIERMTGNKSRALAETEALAAEEYTRHLDQMVAARRKANVARVKYQTAQVWAELLRSANANRRAELQLGGFTP